MHFNNADTYEGTIYIRERGNLAEVQCFNDARGDGYFRRPPAPRLNQKDLSVRLFVDHATLSSSRKDHFVFTYNNEGSLRYSAKPLLDISLLYIADNVQHIESLVGFPEQMAGRLFAAAEEKRKFVNPETGRRALEVFCEAYGDLVLRSLCLRNRPALLFEKLEEIKTFDNVKCLDLHGCELGDSHGIFEHIASETLGRSLSHLLLGGNVLTDIGLQKLTAQARIMRRGLQSLELLDLSNNPISEKGLGYLVCLQKLRGLDLTGTLVKPGESLNKLLWCKIMLLPSASPMQEFCHNSCKTEGWAQEVINQWEVEASKLSKPEKRPRTNTLRFYGRGMYAKETLHLGPAVHNKKQGDLIVRLQFYRPESSLQTQQAESSDKLTNEAGTLVEKGVKRQLTVESNEEDTCSNSSKKLFKSSFFAEDLELLNSY